MHNYNYKLVCTFSLMGKCNDEHCPAQHWRDITSTPDELYLDLLSYQES